MNYFKLPEEFFESVKSRVEQHHNLYRYPPKGEYVEDIFSGALYDLDYDHFWVEGGHAPGADIMVEDSAWGSFSVKSAAIKNVNKLRMNISSYRLTRFGDDIDAMVEFIDDKNFGSYLVLGRRTNRGAEYEKMKERGEGYESYKVLQIPSDFIKASEYEWNKTQGGWKADVDGNGFNLKISKNMSNQYWIGGIPESVFSQYIRSEIRIPHKKMLKV